MLITLAILAAFAWWIMNAGERQRAMRWLSRLRGPMLAAATAGLRTGLAFVRAIRARRRWARAAATAILVLAIASVAGRGYVRQLSDIRPELARLEEAERKMSATYDSAVTQFKLGAMNAESLVRLIDRRIKPELQIARIRLMAIDNVAPEQRAALAGAMTYVRLRDDSWRERVTALKTRDLRALRRVESTERASLAALAAAVHAARPL